MSQFAADRQRISVLYSAQEIAARIDELAHLIVGRLGRDFLVVPILKGSFIFAADLLRALHKAGAAPDVDFLSLSSYREGTVSTGTVRIVRDVESDIEGRSVLLIDDILESGRTLAFAKDLMAARRAKIVEACVLLDKHGKRAADVSAEFAGFDCPDRFVIGYGMDMAHAFRELPFVGYIEE